MKQEEEMIAFDSFHKLKSLNQLLLGLGQAWGLSAHSKYLNTTQIFNFTVN